MVFLSKRKWQEKNIAETKCKDLYRTLHQRKIILQWQKSTQEQWEQLFLSLYKNKKQKETFDIQYKLLNFALPPLTCLRETGQNYGSMECVRCNRADETQRHCFFSCTSSQNIFIYLLCLFKYIRYAKRPAFNRWHPHFCTFTRTENFHPLSPVFCLNHFQPSAFCLMETILSRRTFSQEKKTKNWLWIYPDMSLNCVCM